MCTRLNASRAANHRLNEITDRKICMTVNELAALNRPPGTLLLTPGRALLQGLHVRFGDIGRDLGCN